MFVVVPLQNAWLSTDFFLMASSFVPCIGVGTPGPRPAHHYRKGLWIKKTMSDEGKDEVFPSKVTVAQPECAAAMRPSPNRCGHVR